MARHIPIIVTLVLFLSLIPVSTSSADIKLKVAVVNPSQTESQTTPVRYDLPKGITPNEITDIGSMELKYDFDKGNYYLYKTVNLEPAQKMVFEVRLRDIWTVPEKDINFLKRHTRSLAEKLEHTRHGRIGGELAAKIIERLDEIVRKEAEKGISISGRINLYYENMTIMEEIQEDVGMLENLVIDVGGIVEERVKVPSTLIVPVKTDDKGRANILDLTIRASNPSAAEKQSINVKYILPEEVSPRYVSDAGDLGMGYDFTKRSFYVYKDNVVLEPSETKNFTVKIVDIWYIPDVETDALKAHTDNLEILLKNTEYIKDAKPIFNRIMQNLDEINRVQNLKTSSTDDHIAYYRKNVVLLDQTKDLVSQLEKLATQSGASVGVTVKESEVHKGGSLKERRARGYEGAEHIIKSVFRGKSPSVATTWKIIFGILIFIGILSILFFQLWYFQARKSAKNGVPLETLNPGEGKNNNVNQ